MGRHAMKINSTIITVALYIHNRSDTMMRLDMHRQTCISKLSIHRIPGPKCSKDNSAVWVPKGRCNYLSKAPGLDDNIKIHMLYVQKYFACMQRPMVILLNCHSTQAHSITYCQLSSKGMSLHHNPKFYRILNFCTGCTTIAFLMLLALPRSARNIQYTIIEPLCICTRSYNVNSYVLCEKV